MTTEQVRFTYEKVFQKLEEGMTGNNRVGCWLDKKNLFHTRKNGLTLIPQNLFAWPKIKSLMTTVSRCFLMSCLSSPIYHNGHSESDQNTTGRWQHTSCMYAPHSTQKTLSSCYVVSCTSHSGDKFTIKSKVAPRAHDSDASSHGICWRDCLPLTYPDHQALLMAC